MQSTVTPSPNMKHRLLALAHLLANPLSFILQCCLLPFMGEISVRHNHVLVVPSYPPAIAWQLLAAVATEAAAAKQHTRISYLCSICLQPLAVVCSIVWHLWSFVEQIQLVSVSHLGEVDDDIIPLCGTHQQGAVGVHIDNGWEEAGLITNDVEWNAFFSRHDELAICGCDSTAKQ